MIGLNEVGVRPKGVSVSLIKVYLKMESNFLNEWFIGGLVRIFHCHYQHRLNIYSSPTVGVVKRNQRFKIRYLCSVINKFG